MRIWTALFAMPLLLLGCSKSHTTEPSEGATVQALASLAFDPTTVTITVGETVTWQFGTVAHTVLFDPVGTQPTDITTPSQNTHDERTFNTAGTYNYHCGIHGTGMAGIVQVNAAE